VTGAVAVRPAALLLDFGGVLTTDQWTSARECARREGVHEEMFVYLLQRDPRVAQLFIRLERGELSQADFEPILAGAAGVRPGGLLARLCSGMRAEPRMYGAAERLRREGIRVGILSNSCGAGPFDPYGRFNLDEIADVMVVSHIVRLRKPEPAIYELAAAKLGVAPQACVFVDDSAENVQGARDAGMRAVHHTSIPGTLAEFVRLFGITLA
jgi:putative hydrolase of the HAD superfamily